MDGSGRISIRTHGHLKEAAPQPEPPPSPRELQPLTPEALPPPPPRQPRHRQTKMRDAPDTTSGGSPGDGLDMASGAQGAVLFHTQCGRNISKSSGYSSNRMVHLPSPTPRDNGLEDQVDVFYGRARIITFTGKCQSAVGGKCMGLCNEMEQIIKKCIPKERLENTSM
ncbi:uncharacterized protein LOC135115796 [Scylla paramamosain]|uniref:uncharacterized protein LOC135115796 n=1 Tax=Scylla paramamosain TaxID=85552 RepID=UPI003082AAC9